MSPSRPFSKGRVIASEALHENLWKTSILMEDCVSFQAGQYISLHHEEIPLGYFSIASTLADLPYLWIYTKAPLKLHSQDLEVRVSSPKGEMIFQDTDIEKKWVLCAGGTGITPFLSLIRTYPTLSNRWSLYWSIRQNSDLALLESLPESLAALIEIYHYDISEDRDYYDQLLNQVNQVSKKTCHYFIAGPMPFVEKTGAFLLQHQIMPHQIFSDMKKFIL